MRTDGDLLQLVPVSRKPINDDEREGCMMMAQPVLATTGQRLYLCVGYPVHRFKQEFDPEGRGSLPAYTCGEMGFRKALAAMPVKAIMPTPTPAQNWWALYWLRGELWNHYDKPDYGTITVGDILPELDDYDPVIQCSTSEEAERVSAEIVASIREWLTAQGTDKRLVELV